MTRRSSPFAKLAREAARLAGQAADAKEALYLATFLKPETTTVPVG